jgi:hypothetical protein
VAIDGEGMPVGWVSPASAGAATTEKSAAASEMAASPRCRKFLA